MFNDLKPWHIVVIVVVFVALFGAKRLPDAARSIGKSMRIFKSEVRGMREDDTTYTVETENRPASAQPGQPLPPGEPQTGGSHPAAPTKASASGASG